ncbi:MAG: hypothetical protein IKU06_02865 [Lachnospiraceae bacterium]|nr:hypothetical protein [Lachnospiraceae bacterium]
MNEHDLLESMSEIDEKILERSEESIKIDTKKSGIKHGRTRLMWGSIAAAVVLIICGIYLFTKLNAGTDGSNTNDDNGLSIPKTYKVAVAEYPLFEAYPDASEYTSADGQIDYGKWESLENKWYQNLLVYRRNIKSKLDESSTDIFKSFVSRATGVLLDSTEHKNRIYSPLNIYIILGMLAEITENETRQQVMNVIGYSEIEKMREQLNALWGLNYYNDGATKNVLASSLWLRDDKEYDKKILQVLAEYYYASSFAGEMGSKKYSQEFRDWLDEQTDGMLTEQIKELAFRSEDVMDIATTVLFSAQWAVKFSPKNNTKSVFHAFTGDIGCEYMNKTDFYGTYYWGEKFGASKMEFEGGISSNVLFILPDEGVDVNELLSDPEVIELIENTNDYTQSKTLRIQYSIPKFDVVSQMTLNESLNKLGIIDAFDPATADFSTLTDDTADKSDAYIGKITHDVRVVTDEEGIKATAYAILPVVGAAEPPEEIIDFVLDRPFIFVIKTNNEYPVFIGVVENP